MTLEELIAQFRVDADDRVRPYLWDDEAVTGWFTQAVAEAAIRGRLLHESSNPTVCQIAVQAGVDAYPLHLALYEIDYLAFKPEGAEARQPVKLVSRLEMDHIRPGWRDRTGRVDYAIQSDTSIRLALMPDADGVLFIEGYRVPLAPLEDDDDQPEIHQAHHAKLVHWALHRAFSIPDTETMDKGRAEAAEQAFTSCFGARPDSDLRRVTRQDVLHENVVYAI